MLQKYSELTKILQLRIFRLYWSNVNDMKHAKSDLLCHSFLFHSVSDYDIHSSSPEPLSYPLKTAFFTFTKIKHNTNSHFHLSLRSSKHVSYRCNKRAHYQFWWHCKCSQWEKLLPVHRAALWKEQESAEWWWPSHSHSLVWEKQRQQSSLV